MMHEYEIPQPSPYSTSGQPGAPWTMLDMLKGIGIIILVLLAVSFVAAIAALAIVGDIEDLDKDATALTISLAASIPFEIALAVVAYQFSVAKYKISLADFGFRRPDHGWDHGTTIGIILWGLFAVGLCVAGLMSIILYTEVIKGFGADPDFDLQKEVFDNPGPIIATGVLSVGFAPVMEETFFRGFIFGGLRKPWGILLAALASGLLFGLAHIFNPGGLYVVLPITIIGAIFAWGYSFSGSLYPAMAAHFLFNLFSFIGQLTNQ